MNYKEGEIDYGKIYIYSIWIIKHIVFFFLLSLVLPNFIASAFALILTVAAFFHPANIKQIERVKNPVIVILRPKNVY